MSSEKPTILFIHQVDASFTRKDIEILNQFTNCITFHFQSLRSKSKVLNALHSFWLFIKQFLWLLRHRKNAKAIYCWFSDIHGFLPAVFSKSVNIPMITVLGGFDCNKFEEFNYGIFCSKWRAPIGRFIIRNSTLLLPVSKTLIETNEISKNWPSAHPNGLKENVPKFDTEWKEVPTGYDPNTWNFQAHDRNKEVITVSYIDSMRKVYVKGIDLLIESCKYLPDFSVQIIGVTASMEKKLNDKFTPPSNVSFKRALSQEDLLYFYQNASVYVQLSRTEGLPNVLCEAMLCGCVPVGSAVFGIPYGIGDAGYVVKEPKPENVAGLIKKAHQNAPDLRIKARQRIIDNFSLKQREEQLNEIFRELDILD